MSSGSKKRLSAPKRRRPATKRRAEPRAPIEPAPPELAAWQLTALDAFAASKLATEAVFGGGAALAARHLHHRRSEDLDFFLMRELEPADLRPLTRSLVAAGLRIDVQQVGPRRSLLLTERDQEIGRIDFVYYPFDPIGRRDLWRGVIVESLLDMTVNKLQALLTRFQPRDFVDFYFLLREGPERDVDRLLDFVRAKFDVGADRLALSQRLLLVTDITELPPMLRPVERADLVRSFEELARELVRRG